MLCTFLTVLGFKELRGYIQSFREIGTVSYPHSGTIEIYEAPLEQVRG